MLDNFSWIEENIIAGSSIPYEESHFKCLEELGIKIIVNLTSKATDQYYSNKFKLYHLHIPDFSVPDKELVKKFWKIIIEAEENNEAVVVHCFAGCGRTGTMLALWALLKRKVLNGDEAITYIRSIRECSIETGEQIEYIRNFNPKILIETHKI